jgi:AcrR family transcriptional regulator
MLPAGAPGIHPATVEVDCPTADDARAGCSRSAKREFAICDAALELLGEVGYDRMSMDAVAARARASKATIYRRWPGKRELVLDAVRSRVADIVEPPETGSLRGDIIATLRVMAEGIGGQDAALMAGVLRAMRSTPELADCVRTQVLEHKRYIGQVLVERAVARGELPTDADPDVWHEVAPALMFFRILVTDGPVDDAFLTHVADDVLVPLLARSGQATARQEKK